MAPSVSTMIGNDIPEDVLLIIMPYLRPSSLNALLRSCKRFYGIVVPTLYRSVKVDIPPCGYSSASEAGGRMQILDCLLLSLRHAGSTEDTSRFHPQFIQSISFISYNPVRDLRALPMLANLLQLAVRLRSLQLDVHEDSIPLLQDLFRRRNLLRVPPGSMLDVVHMPPATSLVLPHLDSVRSTKVAVVAAFMERYPLKTAAVDQAVPILDLSPLMPIKGFASHSPLTRLSLNIYAHEAEYQSLVRAIGASFPLLVHLALRCPGRVSATLLEHIMIVLTDDDLLLNRLQAISVNHGSMRGLYGDVLEALMEDDLENLGADRPILREVIFGRALTFRWGQDPRWRFVSRAEMHHWPWLVRRTPQWL